MGGGDENYMPKRDKTSFFGKIMGGSITDNPITHSVSQVQEDQLEPEELGPDESVEEQDLEIIEEDQPGSPRQPSRARPKRTAMRNG